MRLADRYLARHSTPFAAYTALQVAVMRRFVARGVSAQDWCDRYAARFREKNGWMVDGPARTPEAQRRPRRGARIAGLALCAGLLALAAVPKAMVGSGVRGFAVGHVTVVRTAGLPDRLAHSLELHEAMHVAQNERDGSLRNLAGWLFSPSRRMALETEAEAVEVCLLKLAHPGFTQSIERMTTRGAERLTKWPYSLLGAIDGAAAEARIRSLSATEEICQELVATARSVAPVRIEIGR